MLRQGMLLEIMVLPVIMLEVGLSMCTIALALE